MRDARPRRVGDVILLGAPKEPLRQGLVTDGYLVGDALVASAAAIILRTGDGPLDPEEARRVRASLGTRGRVIVACHASRIVQVWTTLRRVGLESKRTLFVHAATGAACEAIVLARVAKRGGLSVELVRTSSA